MRLLRDITSDADVMFAAGRVGTVVGTWADGAAYEVEFSDDYNGLMTVEAECLEPDPQAE